MLLGAAFCSAVFADEVPDNYDNRVIAAQRYFSSVSMQDMIRDATDEIVKTLPESMRTAYKATMLKSVDINMLEQLTRKTMVKNLTAKELNALADFYGSEAGRSSIKKFGVCMAEIMPVLQQEMIRADNLTRQQLQQN